MESLSKLQGFVTKGTQTRVLGTLPANSYIKNVYVHVLEAFNSSGNDLLTVGWDGSVDALVTSIDVSTTGVKSVTLGASNGFNTVAQNVKAYYTNSSSEPSTGKAFVLIDHDRVPTP